MAFAHMELAAYAMWVGLARVAPTVRGAHQAVLRIVLGMVNAVRRAGVSVRMAGKESHARCWL